MTSRTAVLFDRDGTLIVDIPFNTDPQLVRPMPFARVALDRLRDAAIPTAVVSNQSAIAHGRMRVDDVDAINAAAQTILGRLGPIFICPHDERIGCGCRKPAPGLILEAAKALGFAPTDCVVIGDIGSDVEAARTAGARAILVPTPQTRGEEIASAPCTAATIAHAVDLVLAGRV